MHELVAFIEYDNASSLRSTLFTYGNNYRFNYFQCTKDVLMRLVSDLKVIEEILVKGKVQLLTCFWTVRYELREELRSWVDDMSTGMNAKLNI
jgi:hypothetical protein